MTDEEFQPFDYDANDPEVIAAAEDFARRQKNSEMRVVQAIMSEKEGRAWMFKKLGVDCHVFAENMMRDTPERNARFEGERGVGLRLLAEVMEAAPEMFWEMRKESMEKK